MRTDQCKPSGTELKQRTKVDDFRTTVHACVRDSEKTEMPEQSLRLLYVQTSSFRFRLCKARLEGEHGFVSAKGPYVKLKGGKPNYLDLLSKFCSRPVKLTACPWLLTFHIIMS